MFKTFNLKRIDFVLLTLIISLNVFGIFAVGSARPDLQIKQIEGIQIYPKELRGRNIREIRKRQEKSVNWISLKTGLSRTTIYDIEYGLTKPRFSTLEKIAKALKVDIEALG